MHLFKLAFSLVAVGAPGYALFKLTHDAPLWVKLLSLIAGIGTVIGVLIALPQALNAVEETATRIAGYFSFVEQAYQRSIGPEIKQKTDSDYDARIKELEAKLKADEGSRKAPPGPSPVVPPVTLTPSVEDCNRPQGDFVVIHVDWGDPDGGLNLRGSPSSDAKIQGLVPATAAGIGVTSCDDNWCLVKYACQTGWANSRFLAPRVSVLRQVTGVSRADPSGLNMRTGPHYTYPTTVSIPYNATDIIVHTCQPSPNDQSDWCLVTYQNASGWVSGRYLTP
jgi:uncharacterized protein YraI